MWKSFSARANLNGADDKPGKDKAKLPSLVGETVWTCTHHEWRILGAPGD
jgi:hypothetical protein